MKIIAITQDQLISVDGISAHMSKLGGFEMRGGEWAVHFDTVSGSGHVEYLDRRPNQIISQVDFDAHYAWLTDEHQRYVDHVSEQEAKRLEAESAINDSASSVGAVSDV